MKCFFDVFEVIGGHILEGEDIDIVISTHKGMYFIDNKLFMFFSLRDNFSQ